MTQLKEIVGNINNIKETSKKLEDSLVEIVKLQDNPQFIEETKEYLDSVLCVCGHHKSDHFPETNECIHCDCKQLRLRTKMTPDEISDIMYDINEEGSLFRYLNR